MIIHNNIIVLPYDASGGWGFNFRTRRAYNAFINLRISMKEYDVRPSSPNLLTSNFSGGNQQKIILSRELNENPKVLLVR